MRLPDFVRATAVALCLVLAIAACRQKDGSGTLGVAVGDVVDDPDAYYRSVVTVSGEVGEVISPMMFTIAGAEAGEELLVLSVDSLAAVDGRTAAAPVRRRDIVQVTGRLRPFARAEVEDEFGLDFGDDEFDFERQPVLIAHDASAELSSVVVTPRAGSVVRPPTEAQAVTDLSATTAGDADELAGETVHFRNISVAEVVDEHSFWASDGRDSVFVVMVPGYTDDADAPIEQGQTWDVYGLLREVPPSTELIADWHLSQDLVRQLEDDSLFVHGVYAIVAE